MSAKPRKVAFGAFAFAIVALAAALAFAQEPRAEKTGSGATGHAPAAGAAATAGTSEHESGGAQSGEHRADVHEGADAEHEHAGGHHALESINWTDVSDKKRPAFIGLVINFGVLMTIYYLLGRKPVTDALKQRRVTIGKDIDEAQKMLDEAKERAKKYQGKLKNADVDAATTKASLIAAGKGEVERLILEAQEKAERLKRDADRLVEQERKQVHQDILAETVELAVREATQILEKSVSADDHARLAQDLLAELSRRPAAPRSGPTGGAGPSVRPSVTPSSPTSGGAS